MTAQCFAKAKFLQSGWGHLVDRGMGIKYKVTLHVFVQHYYTDRCNTTGTLIFENKLKFQYHLTHLCGIVYLDSGVSMRCIQRSDNVTTYLSRDVVLDYDIKH